MMYLIWDWTFWSTFKKIKEWFFLHYFSNLEASSKITLWHTGSLVLKIF